MFISIIIDGVECHFALGMSIIIWSTYIIRSKIKLAFQN